MSQKQKRQFVFKKEEALWVPNLITYFRMLCIPVFCVLCLVGGLKHNVTLVYWSLGVFSVAAISDLFDGKIARKYNLVSDIGKVFDPLADKLMHICVLLCLCIIGYIPWYVVVFIILKELVMVAISPLFVTRSIVIPAVYAGKVASAWISVAVVVTFFHELLVKHASFNLGSLTVTPDWIMLIIGCILAAYAAGTYIVIVARKMKEFREKLAAGEIDKHGQPIVKAEDAATSDETASENN